MVQNSYDFAHAQGFTGQIADLQLTNVFSRIVETAQIDFGLAVVRGTGAEDADARAALPVGVNDSFLGLSVRTVAGTANAAGDRQYQVGESINVLDKGVIYAICEDGCTQGDPVSFRYVAGTGQLGGLLTTPVASETNVIPNAVWDTTTATGSIGRIKLK